MIESVITAYLAEELNISVSGMVPSPMPEKFVTVEKTGSSTEDKVRRATLAIDSWAPDQETAALLNEEVIAAMYAAVTQPQISEVQCETDYNFTDTKTRKARYSAIFGVVYFDD